jgi:CBS domain-containing protein
MRESTNHIFRADGICRDRAVRTDEVANAGDESERIPTIADLVPVTVVMTRDVTCAARDLSAKALARLIVETRIGCVPVVDEGGHPIGMVTKRDLVEQLLTPSPSQGETAYQLMMPIALSLGSHATVAHAAALMAFEDIHHVPIVADNGVLIGIVSSMDVVRWLAKNDGYGRRAPSATI